MRNTFANVAVAKEPQKARATITYQLSLHRRYRQHVINWIVSPIVLSASSVIGMYRGCLVGERFSFGGTIVVAITLMTNELQHVLGVGSDGYPILGQMYIGLKLSLILATLLSGWPRRLADSQHQSETDKQKVSAVASKWNEHMYDLIFMSSILALQASVVIYVTIRWMI